MTLRDLLCLILVACVTGVLSSSAQSNPDGTADSSGPKQQDIERLLQRESDALDLYQKQVAPAIRCDQADKKYRETCHDMSVKLSEEAQVAKKDVGRYRTSNAHQPVDLFSIYVELESLLNDIERFSVEEEYNEDRNHEVLATAYNSFVKLTGAWFTGEMREVIRTLAR